MSCSLLSNLKSISLAFQFDILSFVDVKPNSVSVWYQFPQYIIITVGETLFAVTGLSFAYSQVKLYHWPVVLS